MGGAMRQLIHLLSLAAALLLSCTQVAPQPFTESESMNQIACTDAVCADVFVHEGRTMTTSKLSCCLSLVAAACHYNPDPVPPTPDAATGGSISTGGSPGTGGKAATGGTTATGGAKATGGSVTTGGSSVVIAWPECSKTFKAGPVVKHKLGRRLAPRRMRTMQPWHAAGVVVHSVLWKSNLTSPLNQGDIGACTGFATAGELSTQPFALKLTNQDGLNIYHWATVLDSFAGTYPPTDTGSDGDSAEQGAIKLGFSKSFVSADTLPDMHAAIQIRPGIFGSNWTTDMFSPDNCGHIAPTGQIEGGHEYEYIGFDEESGKEWFRNSWGQWSLNGYFWMTSADVQTLIDDGGNADFANLNP